MLAGFQVSYVAYKFAFQGQEHNAQGDQMEPNFEGLEMQK